MSLSQDALAIGVTATFLPHSTSTAHNRKTHRKRIRAMLSVFAAGSMIALSTEPALAAVTATGSVDPADPLTWTTSTTAYIGKSGIGTLDIDGGSALESGSAHIGYSADSTGTATVDGVGSMWRSPGGFRVGDSGIGTLSVTDGGEINGSGRIGYNSGSSGTVTLDGPDSTWRYHTVHIGVSGEGVLSVTNGGKLRRTHSGSGVDNSIGVNAGSIGSVLVDGNGSLWTYGFRLLIGDSGTGSLLITNGGYVGGGYATRIGFLAGGLGTVTVDGPGSLFSAGYSGSSLSVGYYGTGYLSVSNGGRAHVRSHFGFIGHVAGSVGTVSVDGSDSLLSTQSFLLVGYDGHGNIAITNGGAVNVNTTSRLGDRVGSTGIVEVHGPDSTFTMGVDLVVGNHGSGALSITSGGEVGVARSTFVAEQVGSSGSIAFNNGTLTTQSLFASPTDLTGAGIINTKGVVSDIELTFDSDHGLQQSFTINEQVTVNLDVNGSGALGAAYKGTSSMTVKDGVTVSSSAGTIGYHPGSTGMVLVSGHDSTWLFGGRLDVGREGSGTLSILNGGEVARSGSGSTFIGLLAGSTGTVKIDGIGSIYRGGAIEVGSEGSGHFAIINGGTASNTVASIGRRSGSTGTVLVDGAGSAWISSGDLTVGNAGSGTLIITNGGAVSNRTGYIGNTGSSTGTVTVDGPRSTWTNSQELYVGRGSGGYLGDSSALNITNGGAVSSASSYLAFTIGSTGRVTVDGAGSTWTIGGSLYIGDGGDGTVTITNGGLVQVDGTLFIDRHNRGGTDYIAMDTWGMLSLAGTGASDIWAFLDLVQGTDDIRYWNGSAWENIVNGIVGVDYFLSYDGTHTTLTVVPEPASLSLLALGGLALLRRRAS